MKIPLTILSALLSGFAFSQVAIGKQSLSSTASSLEFGNSGTLPDRTDATKQKGLILPWVSTIAGQPTSGYTGVTITMDGTFIFDLSDYKVKYRKQGSWFDLTVKNKADIISGITNNTVDSSLQDALNEKNEAKASIGTPTSTNGILVLEATDKAMILPLVDKYSSVIAPSPGMIVYDVSNQMLCVYNGTVWTFWKP